MQASGYLPAESATYNSTATPRSQYVSQHRDHFKISRQSYHSLPSVSQNKLDNQQQSQDSFCEVNYQSPSLAFRDISSPSQNSALIKCLNQDFHHRTQDISSLCHFTGTASVSRHQTWCPSKPEQHKEAAGRESDEESCLPKNNHQASGNFSFFQAG